MLVDHHILHLDNTPNNAHVSNDNHHEMDLSVAAEQSSQDDFVMGQISKFMNINEESASNVNQDDDLYVVRCATTIRILLTLKPCRRLVSC